MQNSSYVALGLLIFSAYATLAVTFSAYVMMRAAVLREWVTSTYFVLLPIGVLAVLYLGAAVLLAGAATSWGDGFAALIVATMVPAAALLSGSLLLERRDDSQAAPLRLKLEAGLRKIADDRVKPPRRKPSAPRSSGLLTFALLVAAVFPGLGWAALPAVRQLARRRNTPWLIGTTRAVSILSLLILAFASAVLVSP